VYLQVFAHDDLMTRATRQQELSTAVAAPRGEIRDRHGRVLGMSVRGYALEAGRRLVGDPDAVAARVCAVLEDCSADERQRMAHAMRMASPKSSRFVVLRHDVPADAAERIAALDEPGLKLVEVRKRHYPNGPLASHVIGFVNAADNVGQSGVERAMDVKLAGKAGRQITQITGLRDHKRIATRQLEAPVAGVSVETTIDATLQFMAERELAATVEEFDAEGGAVIIMDPWTGDILAMANAPTFDPNERVDAQSEARQNRAVQHIYEPGSTFKIVMAAAALEVLRMSPSRMFDVSAGHVQFGVRRIYDDHRYNQLTFTDVIVKSSNVGAIQIGRELGPVEVSRWVSRFGFGEIIARDIPHQRAGQVRGMAAFGPSALASVSMGYQVGVTPLQMVTAVASIANGGELVAPRIVRATIADGERAEVPRRVVRRTMNPGTAAELTEILEQVVERGTATRAKIDGYTVAGKTGTAKKIVNGRYSDALYNASFVGFLPARSPRVAMIVVVDSPRRKSYYGGIVAAPLFKRVGEATLRYLRVPPTVGAEPPVLVARGGATPLPAPIPARLAAGADEAAIELAVGQGVMPDLRGLSARDAMRVVARLGLEARVKGHGFVVRQSVEPGATIQAGRVCALVLTRDPVPMDVDAGVQP
jgi:cell division protein FtsI/penicillin-binding protein 2